MRFAIIKSIYENYLFQNLGKHEIIEPKDF